MIAGRQFKVGDLMLASFLVAVVALLLIPLPTTVLDLLLVANLAFSLLLLLAGLYVPNAAGLLTFPSLLLLLTLFRLSLNVASTRLILSQGDAGTVIQAFGTFLIRGEVVVGIIIFLILTVVNFIVVARGASRVSEVAARFALDALPGRQASIDADLRAGLLTTAEAREKRDELHRESQLYGSMDGAMKFVQGDAIAGLFIIFVNIAGGIYFGVRAGMSLSDAVEAYTTLTVGDGLVHQVPAILVSICAGLVVTRVSSSERASLGSDLRDQLFNRPYTLAFAGLLIAGLGLVPGLPALPFIAVGAVFLLFSALNRDSRMLRRSRIFPAFQSGAAGPARLLGAGSAAGLPAPTAERLALQLDSTYLFSLYWERQSIYADWWERLQREAFDSVGVNLPAVTVRSSEGLGSGAFRVVLRSGEILTESVPLDALVIETSPEQANLFGFDVLAETSHPRSGHLLSWVRLSPSVYKVAEAAGVRVFDAVEWALWRSCFALLRMPEEVISLAQVMQLEGDLERQSPGIIGQSIDRSFLTPARLTEVLQELLREGIAIRDFEQIIESLASYCATEGASLVREGEFDVADIVEFIRFKRRRQRLSELLSNRKTLKVVVLAPETAELIRSIPLSGRLQSPSIPTQLLSLANIGLQETLRPVFRMGTSVVSVLVESDLRQQVRRILEISSVPLAVVTYDELEPGLPVEHVGFWRAASLDKAQSASRTSSSWLPSLGT